MCTPVERDSASYSFTSRPWNMPVLSTIVRPPCSRKPVSFPARISKISARSMEMSGAYWAPGITDKQRLMDGNHTQFRGGDGPKDRVDGLSGGGVERITGGDGWGVTHWLLP